MPIITRYATWTSRIGVDVPDGQRAEQVDALVERGQADDELERRRVRLERIERRREQEHRQDDQLDQVEVLPGPHERRRGHPDRPEGEPDQQCAGKARITHGETINPKRPITIRKPIA